VEWARISDINSASCVGLTAWRSAGGWVNLTVTGIFSSDQIRRLSASFGPLAQRSRLTFGAVDIDSAHSAHIRKIPVTVSWVNDRSAMIPSHWRPAHSGAIHKTTSSMGMFYDDRLGIRAIDAEIPSNAVNVNK
jgi:hypothetical protein